jgi:hypothetical protein
MSEKITIKLIDNKCDLMQPETHSVGANLLGEDTTGCINVFCFPEHKADELGNFNIAAREVFEEYCRGNDLTPKSKNLYSGKIALIDTKHEGNKCDFGIAIFNVRDGVIPKLTLLTSGKDLRIEKNMTCSDLYKRVIDMYTLCSSWFDKVMYIGNFEL